MKSVFLLSLLLIIVNPPKATKHKSVVYIHDFEFKQYGKDRFNNLCTVLLKLGKEGKITGYSDSLLTRPLSNSATKKIWDILPDAFSIQRLNKKSELYKGQNF